MTRALGLPFWIALASSIGSGVVALVSERGSSITAMVGVVAVSFAHASRYLEQRGARRPPRQARRPLVRMDRAARFLWSEKTYKTVFGPLYADLVYEWNNAIAGGEEWKARYIKYVRGPVTYFGHFVCRLPWSLLASIVRLLKNA